MASPIHAFETSVAVEYGPIAAVLVYGLQGWVRHAAANDRHRIHRRTWTYNSVRAWQEQYPYLSAATIRRTLERLSDQRVILVRNDLNRAKWDRTKWYAFADEKRWVPDVAERYAAREQRVQDEQLGRLFDFQKRPGTESSTYLGGPHD